MNPSLPIEEHLETVNWLARKLARRLPRHVALDDLVGAGALGLVDAARRFDPSHGVPFAAYAQLRIRGAMLDELRRNDPAPRGARHRESGQFEPNLLEESSQPFQGTDPGQAVEAAEGRRALQAALSTLLPRMRTVLSLYYQEGLSFREIGERLGVTESRACQLHARALAKLRKYLA